MTALSYSWTTFHGEKIILRILLFYAGRLEVGFIEKIKKTKNVATHLQADTEWKWERADD